MRGYHQGQSLIEVLMGVGIGALFIVAAAGIIAPSLRTNKQAADVQTKAQVANELFQNVKAWAAGNWNGMLALATGTANAYYLSTATSSFTVVSNGSSTTSTSSATIAFVQVASSSCGATSCSVKFGSNNTAGNFIAVVLRVGGTMGRTITMSDTNGNTYTQAVTQQQTTDVHQAYIYYTQNIAAGANTTTVSISGGITTIRIGVHEYSGVATSSALDTATSSQGNGTAVTSGNITTTQASELIMGGSSNDNNGSGNYTAGNTYTIRVHQSCGTEECFASEDRIVTSTLTTSSTFTIPGGNWTGMISTFKAAIISTTTQQGGSVAVESVAIAGTTYKRYFYVGDVYRDSNGNVTSTTSGNFYDPSTKQVTVVVNAASSTVASTTYGFYLTRNVNNVINQTSWSGGSGQSSPVTLIGTTYAAATNITVTATGSIQLSAPSGGSCTL